MGPQLLFPLGVGLVLEQVRLCGEIVHLIACCAAAGATCPACDCWSAALHSQYERHLADLPIAGRHVVVDLRVRRFRCKQPTCRRRTFVEQAPAVAERYAHRTRRLKAVLENIGLALGGRPGSRHCQRLAMPTSRTTLLRLLRALPEPPVEAPRVLGVDEFALRRGRRYGTILVDADTHRVVDLLEDPSADALVEWLDQHPGAQVICRDRDGVYARAARHGAPGALQVADRWHLTHNLADALERFAVRALAQLRKAVKAEEVASPASPACRSPGRLAARTEQRHADIHKLLAQGLSLSAVARQLRLNWRTIRRFASAQTAAEVLNLSARRATALDPFLPYLTGRWQEGQHTAAVLYRELRQQGYRGSRPTVRRQVAAWRTAEPPTLAHAELPGSRTLAWLLLRRPADLDDKDQLLLDELCERNTELATARQLVQQFLHLVRERGGQQLQQWVDAVQRSGPPELRRFSRNLHRDWDAVQAGLTVSWSSGCVEGHVNKLKVIKRQMFGRARFDLLRTRVLLAN